eukprot:1138248-Pelagomonas_calceolata.AAC.3
MCAWEGAGQGKRMPSHSTLLLLMHRSVRQLKQSSFTHASKLIVPCLEHAIHFHHCLVQPHMHLHFTVPCLEHYFDQCLVHQCMHRNVKLVQNDQQGTMTGAFTATHSIGL